MSHLAALKSGAGCDAGVQGVGRAVCFTRAPRGQGRSDALMRSCSTRKWTTACCTRSSGKARRRACCACNESVGARVGTVAALGGADTRPQPCCRSRSCLRCPRSRATYRSSTRRAPPANQTLPYSALRTWHYLTAKAASAACCCCTWATRSLMRWCRTLAAAAAKRRRRACSAPPVGLAQADFADEAETQGGRSGRRRAARRSCRRTCLRW